MLIALDYDGTFTADPPLWVRFIEDCRRMGHEIVIVTMRYPSERIEHMCEVIYTSRQAKYPFMVALGRLPSIWIDDMPHFILEPSA